jgi:hypothetical protein
LVALQLKKFREIVTGAALFAGKTAKKYTAARPSVQLPRGFAGNGRGIAEKIGRFDGLFAFIPITRATGSSG